MVEPQLGQPVLLRSVYRGLVHWCFPHHYAGEWEGRLGVYCRPGNAGKVMTRTTDGYLRRWASGASPDDHVWNATHVLRFMRPGDRHTVELFWDEDWAFLAWYVNVQAPLVVRGDRFDTTDHALDVVVAPDGSWSWKDEDELVEAVALGILTPAEARGVRAEGERVIAERPWPTGWEEWRPPDDWHPLPLPADWHVT